MTEKKKNGVLVPIGILAVVIVIVMMVLFVVLSNGQSSDITISGGGKVVSLKCENDSLTHPALTDRTPLSFTNQITANFQDDKLTSIMYQYEGTYSSAEEVRDAEAFAAADYNTILVKEYGENAEVFSHVFVKDGKNLRLTITGDASKVSSKTAPYFLLDQDKSFPRQSSVMKKAYEDKGFSCKMTE